MGIRIISLLMAIVISTGIAKADSQTPLTGHWHGLLELEGVSLRLELVIEQDGSGPKATLISLDQGDARIRSRRVTLNGDHLEAAFPTINAVYSARRVNAMLEGAFSQNGGDWPLTMQPGHFKPEALPDRAAESGRDREVTVTTRHGVKLAGALRLPDKEAPFPAVLLLNGSGAQDRNSTIAGQPIFAVLASALADAGIASLRLDDRGVGGSDDVAAASPQILAEDARAAFGVLKEAPGIDQACLGMAGHSEGAMIASLAAQHDADARFMLLLAPLTGTMAQTLLEQGEAINRALKRDEVAIANYRAFQEEVFDAMRMTSSNQARAAIQDILIRQGIDVETARDGALEWARPYMQAILDLDSTVAMAAYDGPVTALFAQKDLQVVPDAARARLERAREGQWLRTRILPGVNHLFQSADTGLPAEYASADAIMDQDTLEQIVSEADKLVQTACRQENL